MRNFKKLLIWQKGMQLVDKLYTAAVYFPDEERFGMRSQSTRAVVSIPSNIAEGSAKRSQKELLKYVEVSLGSSFELETHLLVIQNRRWFPKEVIDELLDLITEEQRMISKFMEKIS